MAPQTLSFVIDVGPFFVCFLFSFYWFCERIHAEREREKTKSKKKGWKKKEISKGCHRPLKERKNSPSRRRSKADVNGN